MNDIMPTEALKITERFSRTSATTIRYSITIDDAMTWTAPFTIQYQLKRDDRYGMFDTRATRAIMRCRTSCAVRGPESARRETPQRSQP